MESFQHWWYGGGLGMYLVLGTFVFGVILGVAGVIATFVAKRGLVPAIFAALLIVNAAAALGTGIVMRSMALARVEHALLGADPDVRDEIRALGRTEAAAPLQLGLAAALLPAGLALVLGGVAARRRATLSS